MVFGAIPAGENLTEDPFVMYGDPIQWVDRYKYVGTTFCSTLRDIFTIHYDLKALAAQRIANVTLAAESMTGALPPKERSIVYLARIDVTIISEYDVAVDVSEANLKKVCPGVILSPPAPSSTTVFVPDSLLRIRYHVYPSSALPPRSTHPTPLCGPP